MARDARGCSNANGSGPSLAGLTLAWKFVQAREQEQAEEQVEKDPEEFEEHCVLDTGHLYSGFAGAGVAAENVFLF